ncbi:MAG: M14 family metallocarboxypeptidase [Verrucomicrobiaceae bacterium]|nr:M14 family metallocarboxypeptidase [Verrucomicrobiaceae bacterium]
MKLLPLHHAHDIEQVLMRWRLLAADTGMAETVLDHAVDQPVLAYATTAAEDGAPAIYLSTGVHGDEAGSVWGLLAWAEKNRRQLRRGAFLILPLLNPIGLRLNTRADHRGLDINRRFHLAEDPLSRAWQRWIAGRPMRAGLCLHEDYDAQGCYVYELGRQRRNVGHAILARCTKRIGMDPRRWIDGQRARDGLIRRKKMPTHLPGMPEAIELHLRGCPCTLTFETPSEFALDDRAATQAAFIQAALEVFQP